MFMNHKTLNWDVKIIILNMLKNIKVKFREKSFSIAKEQKVKDDN